MQRRFYNRRAINTVAKVIPPNEGNENKYSPVHNRAIIAEETPLSTILLLLAVTQLTKDRDDMPLPSVLERISPYLDGPQQVQIGSIVNLSKMSSSLKSTKKPGAPGGNNFRDPMKNVGLLKTLSTVANPPTQPVLKNIGDVFEKGQNMSRSLKKMQTVRSGKSPGSNIGEMINVMSNIMPSTSPLSSMGGVIKAAQMVGNMGGMANLGGVGKSPKGGNGGNNNDDIFGDDDDE